MRIESQQGKIKDVQAQCEFHWLVNRIPQDRAEEMGDELGQHLEEAVQDGKTVEDVVGRDTEEFAREWAVANRCSLESLSQMPKSPSSVALNCLSDTLAAITILIGLYHLLLWSPYFSVGVEELLCAVVFTLSFFLFFASSTELSEAKSVADESFWESFPKWLRISLYVALFILLAAWSFLPLPRATLFVWPWQATLVLPVITAIPRLLNELSAGTEEEAK